jgi:hypothetical protein
MDAQFESSPKSAHMKQAAAGETIGERSETMADLPRDADIQTNRERQLLAPYPYAAKVVDEIVAAKRKESPPTVAPEEDTGDAGGLKTTVPTNYQASFGGQPKSMTAFEVKRSPGRL